MGIVPYWICSILELSELFCKSVYGFKDRIDLSSNSITTTYLSPLIYVSSSIRKWWGSVLYMNESSKCMHDIARISHTVLMFTTCFYLFNMYCTISFYPYGLLSEIKYYYYYYYIDGNYLHS